MIFFNIAKTAERSSKISLDRSGYAIFCRIAYEALAKWHLNGWRDQNFCEGQSFRF